MIKNFYKSNILCFLLIFLFCIANGFQGLWGDEALSRKLEYFLQTNTQEARSMVTDFKTQQIESILNNYKKNMSQEGNRTIWLIEEYYQRKADRIASSRLVFLFIAVVVLILLLVIMVWMNLKEQKKLYSKL